MQTQDILKFNPDTDISFNPPIESGRKCLIKDFDIKSKRKIIVNDKTFIDYKAWAELDEWTKHEAVSLFLERRPQDAWPAEELNKYVIVYNWVNGWFIGNSHRPRYFINKFKENFPNSWEGV